MKQSVKKNIDHSKKNKLLNDKRFIAFIYIVVIFILYGQTLNFGFTWFDDDVILLRNKDYISDFGNLPGSIIRDAEFRKNTIELYRPLQNVSFITDAAIGGFRPGMFHLTNMLLHLASVIMLFFLLETIGFNLHVAFLGGLLLAMHPVFAFTVNWLPARGDLLFAFWTILSFYLFIVFLNRRKTKWLWWHLAAFFFAIMSKETAIIIIPVCTLYYVYIHNKQEFYRWQLIPAAGYSVIVLFYFFLRKMAVHGIQGDAFGLSPFIYNLQVIPETMFRFFVPYPIVALPFYSLLPTIGGVAIIAIITWVSLKFAKNQRLILFGAAWFVGFTIPSMLYRPEWSDYIYDYIIHRSYLPFVGLIIIVLEIYDHNRRLINSRLPGRIAAFLFIIFAILNYSFTREFKDPITFWKYAVKTNERSAFTHLYLGGALFFENQHSPAIESYSRALKIKPDLGEALINRGITYASAGDHKSAVKDFSAYLDLFPGDTMAIQYRSTSFMELADYSGALPDLIFLRSAGYRTEKVMYSLALCKLLTGNYPEAKHEFDSLLNIYPDNFSYLKAGALADLMNGEADQAIAKYQKVLKVDLSANILSNLGYAYWQAGMYNESLDNFERAEVLSAENLSVSLGLMLAYSSLGKDDEVRKAKDKALKTDPSLRDGTKSLEALQQGGYLFTPEQLEKLKRLF